MFLESTRLLRCGLPRQVLLRLSSSNEEVARAVNATTPPNPRLRRGPDEKDITFVFSFSFFSHRSNTN
ncbi:hypothetical protein Y032_0390g541 [Ancylostoma ceylanicum]|uniref:Uncharacterized protein n=1 Tax=Ancylostoma ceylanicum TaxID=53326 RepID=A0A016RST5_9BILA|nr:hypothetical protein Y032_0390g541 [Ancylostoma ceylanicum]